jgi:hypothetical protein
MPRNPDLPRPTETVLSKADLLAELKDVDSSDDARARILAMETAFRQRISNHVAALPAKSSSFQRFNTSPFVLMFYARQKGYSYVSEIEEDILPAKLFSSMETSAGRMVQDVVLPIYGWESVESTMHSASSVLDGRRCEPDIVKLATLKSGPRCLNDEMSKDLADDIVGHSEQWAEEAGVDYVDFTYGVLYGTKKQSNKKDWHILRNIVETRGTRFVIQHPRKRWDCSFRIRGTRVNVAVRIGADWWAHLGGPHTLMEIMCALIRACVTPASTPEEGVTYTISDLGEIISTESVPDDYNVSLLQRSQIQWLFFFARHYCDRIED